MLPSSLEKQASPSDSQEIATNQASVEEESPLAVKQQISSASEMENNGPAVDGEVVWVWLRYVCVCESMGLCARVSVCVCMYRHE